MEHSSYRRVLRFGEFQLDMLGYDLRRKGRAVGIAGDRADVDARGDELGDEGAADVAGGARDENRKHVIKDGTGAQKVTVRGA